MSDDEALAFPETPFSDMGWFKPVTMEVTFKDVDPEALGILTGGVMGTMPKPEFSLTITGQPTPVRRRAWRVVWEFVTRTPRQYHPATTTYFPRVRLEQSDE